MKQRESVQASFFGMCQAVGIRYEAFPSLITILKENGDNSQ